MIPYADTQWQVNPPDHWRVDVAAPYHAETPSPQLTIPPINLNGKTRAVIVFTDATRHSPDQWLAENILAALPLPAERISFLCAVGMHRPSTHAEKVAKLGSAIVERYAVLDHDPAQVVTVGAVDGIPVQVNPLLVVDDSFVIALGVVEPHQYAGYSGGAKTVVIGCGGAETISRTHAPAMLDREGVRLGSVAGNPFQQFVRAAGARIGIDLIANVVMSDSVRHVAVGDVSVHDDLIEKARQLYETPVANAPYDVVVAGVSAPKAVNFYQASRAATYIGLSAHPVIRSGGVIVVPAAMPEGVGQGIGEQNFYAALQRFGATPHLMQHLREQGCHAGEQRAYMLAQLLARVDCVWVGAQNPQPLRAVGLRTADTLQAAFAAIRDQLPPHPKLLIVPDALHTLPTP